MQRAARWPEYPCWKGLTAEVLREVAGREGIDFATALLYERLVRSREHGPFIQQVQAGAADNGDRPSPSLLAIVPGACYVEYPRTGADGRRLRECAREWGWRVERVPVASLGSLSTNARAVGDWLASRPEEPLVLVSLSKGGADVKTALASPATSATFRNVRVWISLSGILHGTPLAGWCLRRGFRRLLVQWLCWYRGLDFAILRELDHHAGSRLAAELVLPSWLKVVHVVGLPLSCHLRSRSSRRAHRRLAALGPNDGGGILLGDLCRLPGLIYPVWGTDHYLEPAWDLRPLIHRVLHAALGKPQEQGAVMSWQSQVVEASGMTELTCDSG
jgi:hypothetical protein